MDAKLLDTLKKKCEVALSTNIRFHDYGHALEVLENTKKILQTEAGDEDILFASALFHDVSNESGTNEGIDGAKITEDILINTPEFPQDKIKDVCRLIKSISGDANSRDELIINEADRMAVFSKLSLIRGFMIYAKQGLQPKEAIDDFLIFIERKYQHFKIPSAKKFIQEDYQFLKKFLLEARDFYSVSHN
jgi:HD superfamily phosphodiesterase